MAQHLVRASIRMNIEAAKPDLDLVKELKVKIPVAYHVKLHSLKILTGKQMRETIVEALDEYFRSAARAGLDEDSDATTPGA